MTHQEFIMLVKEPQTVKVEQMTDLKEMVEMYPYFVSSRLFLAKAAKLSNSIHSASILNESSVFCSDRRWLYNYIFPEKSLAEEPTSRFERVSKTSGNYFDMLNVIESTGGDTKQSLKNMAEKLKEARAMVVKQPVDKIPKPVVKIAESEEQDLIEKPMIIESKPIDVEISEINAKKLISERKYSQAIEILRALNLNNPKKSVYFADQIRFLEKVISNSKK